ncbi:MAG: hypothetical protein FWD26_09905 [Treponema sp.]|nr:hypothetical protein [Treponema sp.]
MAKITDKLDNINSTLEKMLKVMEKPEHPVIRFLIVAGMIASVLAIISSIDIGFKWLKGDF